MSTTDRNVIRISPDGAASGADLLVVEAPLEIRIDTTPIAVLMRTPGHEREMITGFALTEGIVLHPDEIGSIDEIASDRWSLEPAPGVSINPDQFRRNLYSTSSCGVCGKASIDAVRIASPRLPGGPKVGADLISSLPHRLGTLQPVFDDTGGLHAAALFDPDGSLVAAAEDIGRHNAVDKVVGMAATRGWPTGERVLMVSGRVSFEIVQKAAVAGIPLVAGVSAASSLAVDLAEDLGMTVIGFARNERFVIYNGEQRIDPPAGRHRAESAESSTG